jgi:hypothetical protein
MSIDDAVVYIAIALQRDPAEKGTDRLAKALADTRKPGWEGDPFDGLSPADREGVLIEDENPELTETA